MTQRAKREIGAVNQAPPYAKTTNEDTKKRSSQSITRLKCIPDVSKGYFEIVIVPSTFRESRLGGAVQQS